MGSPSLRLFVIAAVLLPLGCADYESASPVAPVDPSASIFEAPGLTVMSQNLYLGANLDLLFSASGPEDFLVLFQQLLTSNAAGFGRAQQIAQQIVVHAPHLVGIQEGTRFTFTTEAGTQTLDFLVVLKMYLDALHAAYMTPYTWTVIKNETVYTGPIALPGLPVITYADGDAILVRNDVEILGAPTLASYDTYETYSMLGMNLEFHRGFLSVPVRVEGHDLRFANTHLEVQRFVETQTAQAQELIDALDESTLPVILVGDFNSAANHDAGEDQKTPAYRMLRNAGYADLWIREPGSVAGYTCCQAGDLTNEVSLLDQRLDLILVRYGNAGFGGWSEVELVGEEPGDRITLTDPSVGTVTLWPSDHAGVAATLWPAPGLRKK